MPETINFYSSNEEHAGKHAVWSYVYFHGVLEDYANEIGAHPPDIIEADISLTSLSDGIYAGVFHYSANRKEKCLAFVYTVKNQRRGFVVHTADRRGIDHAFNCFTEKREVI